jgi:hypothetical protein
VRYEPRPRGALFAWALVALLSALTVPGTYELLSDGGAGGAAWVSLRLVVLAYVADRLLLRTAVELRLDGDVLAWRSPLAAGQVALADVEAVRPARFASQWQVLDLRGQRALYVEAMRGIGAFVDDLQRARPGLPVRLGSRARRLEGRSAS